ncbi:hypothetical protein CP532_0068 [Ophiocordyceps camponoti-leonardi (nom. inval.)]|nr:hypothetical protein CP532_0068 [Ophiocordyceps camponoti-leonardi (nom. inval.)]
MPYTPPSQLSPTSSASTSPLASRRSSVQSGSRPALPHSASYLSKHRRTPSIGALRDDCTDSSAARGAETDRNTVVNSLSPTRLSPPTDDQKNLASLVSPVHDVDDDDDNDEYQDAATELDSMRSLRDAVSQIPQPRTASPPPASAEPIGPTEPMRVSLSTTALDGLAAKCSRAAGHVRSATEPSRSGLSSTEASLTGSDEDTDEDLRLKPPMVRKKSGELVRPALRPSHRRPSSVPGTPIFSKAVHFDSHLEHVRHFLQVDRPLAVSAGSSPIDNHESDGEYPFPEVKSGVRSPPFEWELATNFPLHVPARKALPVRLERVWLSADHKSLLGSVSVANLAFQKHVTCRFTFDYWKTVSEVGAEYSHEIQSQDGSSSFDRFSFSIKLSDVVSLESKTLYFCIRYLVSGQELWDNNGSTNFQVDFKKKHLPQMGKNGAAGAASRSINGLPRSNSRRPNTGSSLRPMSMPSLDAFGHQAKMDFDQPIHEYLGESGPTAGLRLKHKSSTNLASDNIARNLTSPSGVAFSNRYDFGASLSAAMQAAKDSGKDKDTLYMRRNVRGSGVETATAANKAESESPLGASSSPTGTHSPNSTLPSASYEELVNKYCFFGSKQSSPLMTDGTIKGGAYDGGKPEPETVGEDKGSLPNEKRTAMHHSIHLDGASSYFPPLVTTARALAAASGTPSSEMSFRGQQQTMPDRYPWTTETQTATVILG